MGKTRACRRGSGAVDRDHPAGRRIMEGLAKGGWGE